MSATNINQYLLLDTSFPLSPILHYHFFLSQPHLSYLLFKTSLPNFLSIPSFPQRYALEFAFHHAINSGSAAGAAYTHLKSTPGRYRAALAFQLGIQLLLRDAENAISDGIHDQVRASIAQFGPTSQTNDRIANLNTWLTADGMHKKFSHYSPQFPQLVYAITNTLPAAGNRSPLPGINRTPISPHLIGRSLFAKANRTPTPSGRPRIMSGAPLFKGGSFNRILQSLIQMVCSQITYANPSDEEKKAFVGDTAVNVFNHLRITVLPWSDAQSGSDSAPAIFNSWITIASSSQPPSSSSHKKTHVTIISDDEIDMDMSMDLDTPPGPSSQSAIRPRNHPPPFVDSWIPSTHSLLDLPALLSVTLRPDELEHISSEALVMKDVIQENYHWAYSAYSAHNPIHKLAFIIASVFSRMAPTYMVVTKSAPRNHPPLWTDARSSTRRPLVSGPICFGWWLTYLIIMLDSDSPLRRNVHTAPGSRRVILGADWADTMSKHLLFNDHDDDDSSNLTYNSTERDAVRSTCKNRCFAVDICKSILWWCLWSGLDVAA